MLKKLKLTEKETRALHSLVRSCANNGYDFGFTDEEQPLDWKPRTWAAVIGSLTKKGVFAWTYDLGEDDGVDCCGVQMQLTPQAYYTAECVGGLQHWERQTITNQDRAELDEAIQQLSHAEVESAEVLKHELNEAFTDLQFETLTIRQLLERAAPATIKHIMVYANINKDLGDYFEVKKVNYLRQLREMDLNEHVQVGYRGKTPTQLFIC